jgi:catechol 2,3-dioxygenase-like lactoylglutathione lyase family enzyme
MIGYTCVGTNDLPRALAFYEALFASLGAKRYFELDRGVGWGVAPDKPMFSVLKPFDGEPATIGNGTMVSLVLKTTAEVDAMHAKALALGGQDEGAPGFRGGDDFYAASFRDLDGNKLAAYCVVPPKA